ARLSGRAPHRRQVGCGPGTGVRHRALPQRCAAGAAHVRGGQVAGDGRTRGIRCRGAAPVQARPALIPTPAPAPDGARRPERRRRTIMATLSQDEARARLQELEGWTLEGNAIRKQYVFKGFPEAVAFVSRLVPHAEAADHHPDVLITYKRVTLTY